MFYIWQACADFKTSVVNTCNFTWMRYIMGQFGTAVFFFFFLKKNYEQVPFNGVSGVLLIETGSLHKLI
jgi:hypothetical protein